MISVWKRFGIREKVGSSFTSYIYQKAACYQGTTPTLCTYNGKIYWMGWTKRKYLEGHTCQEPKRRGTRACAYWTYKGHWDIFNGGEAQDHAPGQLTRETMQRIKQQAGPRPPQLGSIPVYDQLRKDLGPELDFPTLGKSLYIGLTKSIAREFNVTNCWIYGGALMSEKWPWRGTNINALNLLQQIHPPLSFTIYSFPLHIHNRNHIRTHIQHHHQR